IEQFGEYKGWWFDSKKLIQPHEWAAARAIEKGETSIEEEVEIECFDGTHKIILNSALPIRGSDGAISGAIIVNQDITERKRAEVDIRIAATAFESQESMLITDADGVILKVNQAFTEATGYTAEEAVGRTPRILKSGRHGADFYREMWGTLLRTGKWQGEIWDKRKNGEIYPKLLTISAVRGDDGAVTHYVESDHDITKRKEAEEEIHNLAFYDSLTQLPNRRLLNDRLGKVMAASKRSGRYGALMFLDLDNFKPLNDEHGHGVGDLLLVEAARRIAHCVREVDTVARFGGDEFVVVLSELDEDKAESVSQTSIIAEKIRTALAEPYVLKIQPEGKAEIAIEHHCTSSIGVVLFTDHEAGEEDILKWADMAMYQAKEAGRNQVRFYKSKA
ncbi:MAG: diguanylate cyclase, partial [Sideroxydans sp.]